MSEVYPSDNSLLNLTSESETGVEYIETGKAPYYLEFRRLLYRLLLGSRRANDFRVFDEGGLNIGVKAGKCFLGASFTEYGGSTGNTLGDDKPHIYIYLNSSGALVIDEYSSWPNELVPHVRLAEVTTSGGDITAIVDARSFNMFHVPGAYYYDSVGGQSFILTAELTAGSTVQIYNAAAPFKFKVLDAWSVAKSADGGTWKLTDGSNDISDTVTVTGTDKTIDRVGTIDDAYHEIAAGWSLSVVGDGANADVIVYINCIRVS